MTLLKKIIAFFQKKWYRIYIKEESNKVDVMNNEINHNIIKNSYYMIKLFTDENKEITNLKLQKLMYFVEAYYMVKNNPESYLYDSEWSAWDYGPVNVDLYNHYKKFGSLAILLSDENKTFGEQLPATNKKYIKDIYNLFGDLSAFQLVTLTHLKGSPWYKIYTYNQEAKVYNFNQLNSSIISKEETKEWMKQQFSFIFEGDN